MSTDENLTDPIETTKPASDDGIGTPAASISTQATPEEVATTVEADSREGLISVSLLSEHVQGSLLLEAEPARQLRDDLDAALDELGDDHAEGSEQ
jgi:hypothetical protein